MRTTRHSAAKVRRAPRVDAAVAAAPSSMHAVAASVPAFPSPPLPSRLKPDGVSPHAARVEALKERTDMRSTGARFLKRELQRMKTFVREGRPCRVVFDLDNTLFDTRSRTLAVGHSFDAARALRGQPPIFAGATKVGMGYDAAHTIAALQKTGVVIDDETAQAFVAHWAREFWSAAMMVHDDPMHEILFWAQAAHDIGVEVVFLTGRSSKLPDGTASGFERSSYDELPEFPGLCF